MLSSDPTSNEADFAEAFLHFLRHNSICSIGRDDVLRRCGAAVLEQLSSALAVIENSSGAGYEVDTPSKLARSAKALQALRAMADQKMQSTPFSTVAGQWLRLYVDSTVGIVLGHVVMMLHTQRDMRTCLQLIKTTDLVLIIAGAVGRVQMVQDLAELLQILLCVESRRDWTSPSTSDGQAECTLPIAKRRRLLNTHTPWKLCYASSCIPEYVTPPSLSAFRSDLSKSPFVIRGYLREPDGDHPYRLGWPSLARWNDLRYLLDLVGTGRVVPVEIGSSYTETGWSQRIVSFEDFLYSIGYPKPSNSLASVGDVTPLYLAQYSLLSQFPQLASDIVTPDYVFSEPTGGSTEPYQRPGNEEGTITNVWVGSGSGKVNSPAHTDPFYNCYSQVLGHKRVWLAPPKVGPYMYTYREESRQRDGGKPDSSSHCPPASTIYQTNTSAVDVFQYGERETQELRERYPEFYASVYPISMETVLGPGDMLFMPPGWWHAMRGEGDAVSWSVSIWF